ncbi:MAG: peptidoglycan DD-metalloendopeptidase family protein [Bacteroidales bacterium]
MQSIIKKVFGIILILFTLTSFAQDKKTLEANKKQLEKEIKQTTRILNETKKNKKASLLELNLLVQNIKKRQKLIQTLDVEMRAVSGQITQISSTVQRLEVDIATLKKEYASMLVSAYNNRNQYSRIMFILSSKDFNQAYRRLQYLRQYTSYQRQQVELIKTKQTALVANVNELQIQKQSKEQIRQQEEQERLKLKKEEANKNVLLGKLKKKESILMAEIQAKQKKRKELNRKLERIIQEEIRKSNEAAQKRAAREGKAPQKTSTTNYSLTPAEKILSKNFEGNRGSLPWPVDRGSMSSGFGAHDHPLLKGVVIVNNGIDIAVPAGTKARVVFDGEVSNVVNLYNVQVVMVRHGAYTTVYSNLDQVYVHKGQKVTTKQSVGRVYTNTEEGKTELQFQIWKGTTKLNPASWISR